MRDLMEVELSESNLGIGVGYVDGDLARSMKALSEIQFRFTAGRRRIWGHLVHKSGERTAPIDDREWGWGQADMIGCWFNPSEAFFAKVQT